MNKILLFLVLIFSIGFQSKILAQANQDTIPITSADIIRTTNDLKSGNWQDVLSNFFQFGISDLTGVNKAFNFKSTLFALKLKTNPNLNVDTNYINHTADRNLQFNFAIGIDSQFHFNGFSGGISYSPINKRDTTLISFINKNIDTMWLGMEKRLANDYVKYKTVDTSKDKHNSKVVKSLIDSNFKVGNFDIDLFPKDFQEILIKDSIPKYIYSVFMIYKNAKANTMKMGLLTFSLNGAFKKQASFDSVEFGGIYLQGLTKSGKSLELDLRANVSLHDTLIGNDKYRTIFNSSGGLNYALISNSKNKYFNT